MVRSRFPGKPSKFHNRKQVNVSKLTSAQENENAKAAELIYRNLAIFHQTFGPEDPEGEPFAGFRSSDIKASKQTAQQRFEEISKGIKARQIIYLPQEAPKKGLPSGGAGTSKGVKVQKASRTSANVKKCSVTLNDCNSFNLNCDAGSSHVRRILEDVEEEVEEDEDDDESTGKKELLKRKKQSVRLVAAPNKRFYDHNSDESLGELNCNKLLAASPGKIVLKKARLIVDVSGDAWSRQARDEAQPASDVESETSSVKSSSTSASSTASASSRASSVSQESCASDYGQCRPTTPEPKKIVLREARLEVDTQSITKKSGLAHRIVCGVCGAIRFYKFLKQARKFGLWSCESCRKFVSRMIQFASPVTCINGDGSCKITKEESSIVWNTRKKDVVKEIKSRCRACWLLLCMKYYQMPINIKIKLNQSLPQSMRDPELLKKKSAINKSISQRKSSGSSSETKKPVPRKLGFRILRRYSTVRGARTQLGRKLRKLGRHDRGKITVGSDKAASESALSRKRSASGPVKKVRFTDNSGSERVNAKQTTTPQDAPKKEELRNSKRLRDGSTKKSDNKEIDDGDLNQLDEGEEDSEIDLKLSELSKKCVSKALQSNSESLLSTATSMSPRPLIHSPKLRLDSPIIDLTVEEQGENSGENRRPKRRGSQSSQVEQAKSDKLEQEKGDRLSQAAQPNGESTRQKRKAALNSRANIARVAGRVTESKTPADNKLEVAKNLKKRATALARKEVAPTKPKQDVKKVKRKKNLEASAVVDRVADRGPRVKHVCRSAKLALGSPVATFSSNQPVSVKSNAKEMTVEEDDDDTPIFIPIQSDNPSIKNNAPEVTKSEEVISISSSSISHRLRQPSTEISSRERDESSQLSRIKSSQSPPKYIARTLQDLGKQNCELLDGIVEERQDCMVTMDFWESYDPEEVSKTGFALLGSDLSFRVPSLCFLCGSAGKDRLIHCACCCEPYHRYCVEGGTRDWGGDGDDPAWWRIDWLCPRCTVCAACGQAGSRAHLACNKCRRTYHADCLPNDRLARLHSTDRAWVCHSCLRCRSCNDKSVSMFVGNLPLCNPCFKLRQKGNFCPLCQRCYDDDDFDTKMMECGKCKCWVHAKCEGLSNEKYEVLSFLPESVEFICKLCAETTPASWRTAIETELRTGFMNVLKSLSKNRKACELLKSSQKNFLSICSCVNSTVRAGTKFAEIGATDSSVSPIAKSESADSQRTSEQSVSCDMSESSINTECLPNPDPTEPSLGKVKSQQEESKTEGTMVLPQEQCLPRVELQIRSSDFDQQLFLPNGNRLSDSKAAQYSPHATSQSDSGIGSTDDELKPSPVINDAALSLRKQCFCYEPESRRKSTQPTLIHVKKKVYSNDYTSLFEFHQDMQKVIWSADDIDLSKYYNQTLQDIFPWFDPKYSQVCQRKDTSMIVTPKKDEADKEDSDEEQDFRESYKKTSEILGGLLDLDKDYYYRGLKLADVRVCVLCKQEGDGELIAEGRLLYCGHNEWIHANCALWSNEVFEEIDGSLQNVHSAISRSRLIRCVDCDKRGASVGCCYKNCPESYHFPCARKGRCAFMEDKTIYCNLHRGASRSRPLLAKEFPVYRPVYVELDRRKKKLVPHNQVRIMIGSLSVDHIGEFVEEISDHESTIVPCQFVCTRLFWSSLEPWRLVQYTVRTRILKTKSTDHSVETEANFTFDHSLEHSNTLPKKPNESDEQIHCEVKQLLDSMLDAVCVKEEESCLSDAQNAADLLPPELKDAIFEDLPFDLLDGISMQDIFPKMMSYDDPMDVKIEKECRPDVKTADSVSNKPPKSSNLPRLEQTNKRLPLSLKHKMHGTSTGKTPRFSSKEPIKPKAIVKPDINTKVSNRFHSGVGPNSTPTKIVQLDGTVDYSSESEFPANESDDSSFTPTLHVTIQDTVAENVEERSRGYDQLMKCRLLQVDGANDLTSDSESGSLKQEEESDYSDIDQLDGAVDVDVSTDDKPVKCNRCHRTYRTALSYQRHFPTCSSDFISSCSESDSSEEDKVPSPAAAVPTLPPIQEEVTLVEPTSDYCQGTEDVVEYVVETHESPNGVQQSMCINSALYDQSENIVDTTDNEIYSYVEETEVVQEVPFTSTPSVPQNCIILSNDNDGIKLKPCGENTYYIDDKQFNSAAVLNSLNQLLNAKNEQAKKPKVSFVSTPVNHAINVGPSQSSSSHQVIDYQNQSSPTIILQSVPSQNRVQSYPSYIDSYPQQTSQQGIQYIAAIEQPEKQSYPLLSQSYQLQSSPVQTAVIPTVLGTIIQPNGGMEQVILNTNTNSIDGSGGQLVFGQQSTGNNLYISNQPQMYVNMETVVSNTVMSSSQFVSVPGSVPGMLSTYSATTTQVYQAAKPVIDLPQSYVILNTSPTSAQVVQNGNSRSPNNIPTQPPRPTVSLQIQQPVNSAQLRQQAPQQVQVQHLQKSQQQNSHQPQHPRQNNHQQQQNNHQQYQHQPQNRQNHHVAQNHHQHQTQNHKQTNYPSNQTTPKQVQKPPYSSIRQKIIAEWSDKDDVIVKPAVKPIEKPAPIRKNHDEKKKDLFKMVNATEQTIVIESVAPCKFKYKPFNVKTVPLQKVCKQFVNAIPIGKVSALPKINPPQMKVFPHKIIPVQKFEELKPEKQQPVKQYESCEEAFDRLKNSVNKASYQYKSDSNSSCKDVQTNGHLAKKSLTEALVKASTTNITNSVDASLAGRTLINNKKKPLCYQPQPQPTVLNGNQVHQKPSFDAKAKRKDLEEAMLLDKALNDAECIIVVQSNTDVVQIKSNEKPVVDNVLPKSISVNTGAKVDTGGKKENVKVNGSKPSKSAKLKTQGCSKKEALKKISDTVKSTKKSTSPKIIFEINSQDGFSYSSSCLEEAWEKVFEAVQTARLSRNLPPLPKNPFRSVNTNMKMLGLDNNSLKYILEQIPGVRKCVNYRPKYHKKDRRVESELREEKENESGCARSEPFAGRNKYDMFSWLASRHRRPPKLLTSETDIVNGNRVIRSALTDKRERFYTSKGIGCYMFRIDDHFVVDATMKGNAARFINHSCEPNCYSRVVDILGKKHILIFALRRIPQGEELTYDYKFPLEDDKIRCHCLSRKCRKYLN
ncbi:histone-lysine N-methyltransferase trithorax [Nilaparvata lugens]|uniref:histone-lysine N-methyltransferase trithorax n=1 Tax=Nilaparvata lugens TaxID=108931 RepID=UPI00193CC1F5|nr:histone-lysine N-methyltransferase trithorax [Nilaparvata lugens]